MRLLLDTHALLWWWAGDPRSSPRARAMIEEETTEVLVSAATAWEISTKVRLGKLPGAQALLSHYEAHLREQRFTPLPVAVAHALRAGQLPGPHRDPFDRMLIAQAQAEGVPLASNEALFDRYGVQRIW